MTSPSNTTSMNRRVLVVDDNEAIHADFRKILTPKPMVSPDLLAAEAELFGDEVPVEDQVTFEVETAAQGQQAYEMVEAATAAGQPFAVLFVDMRMPPGWDGLETIERIWQDFPDIEMVICTAFSDYSWEETISRLGRTDRLLVLKKPFDPIEVLQAASALTHKWNLQQQVACKLDELNQAVATRTADLESARDELMLLNSQLMLARDAAEAANQAKTVFLANISHELRTPMTAILGYSEDLRDNAAAGGALAAERAALETIRRNAKHMVDIINDLLDVSKLEAGKLTVEKTRCAPLEIVNEVVELLRPKADTADLTMAVRYLAPVPKVIESDPQRLRQILLNLVDNAIKFTKTGSVEIEIDIEGHEPTAQLQIEVMDTGVGLTAEQLERLFRPFEQADRSTTREFGGTGLGLAISRELARLLGGDIRVTSGPGAGSRFRLRVPTGPLQGIARVAAPAGLTAASSAAPVEPTPSSGNARVLLVEDGPDNQRLISHVLRRSGCDVEVVENGQQCLDAMATTGAHFDVVLMDMQMPVMDGLTATRSLRQRGEQTPIIALTASAMPDDERACLGAGCNAFLTKPIDRRRLVEVVGELAKPINPPPQRS